eukprot:6192622-Pleurochrysis_carterae.AAC.2
MSTGADRVPLRAQSFPNSARVTGLSERPRDNRLLRPEPRPRTLADATTYARVYMAGCIAKPEGNAKLMCGPPALRHASSTHLCPAAAAACLTFVPWAWGTTPRLVRGAVME